MTPNLYPIERPIVNENRDSVSMERDDFWIGYILIGYQPGVLTSLGIKVNMDPPLGGVGGASPTLTDASVELIDEATTASEVESGSIGSIVYIETMRDYDFHFLSNPQPGVLPDFRTRTAPHELGHQFGLRGDAAGFGIMSVNEAPQFDPRHINVMRWRLSSPGVPY